MPAPGRHCAHTRRAFLAHLSALGLAGATGKGQIFPSARRRYADPTTEFEVLRLTDPAYTTLLPAPYGRIISQRGSFLLCASDRSGSLQALRLDWKNGESRQLTELAALDSASLTMHPDDHSFFCFDGPSLQRVFLPGLRAREVYHVPDGWQRGAGFSVSEDGMNAFLVESRAGGSRLRMAPLARGTPATVCEAQGVFEHPMPRPRRAGILYRRDGDSLWLVNYDGRDNRRLKTAPGGLGPALWSWDGRTAVYLNFPEDRRALTSIREHTPDTNADQLVAATTQFVQFGRNVDASVFVGASGSKASPHVLVLLRVARRELTLCEHRASDPRQVTPIFSPDSQRIFFQSDRHGKPAIYTMSVEKFVERTED